MEYRFPTGFIWGSATAALQIEGAATADGRGPSIWDTFCSEHPERIWEQATPEIACDHYHRVEEDVALIKALGHNGYRLSISWPRLFPTGNPHEFNSAGAVFYHRLFELLHANGIEPNVTLYHWDLPQGLADQGGWENPATIDAYVAYALKCFHLFGHRVRLWATFNEPGWMTLNGWVTGLHPPCKNEFKAAVQVATHLLVAHSRAVQVFREGGFPGSIGLVLNMSTVYPASKSPADVQAAQLADAVLNRWFIDPVLSGAFPAEALALYKDCGILPILSDADRQTLFSAGGDFLGVNYYYPHHASAVAESTGFHINTSGNRNEDCQFSIAGLFQFVKNPNGRYTDWGWEIFPEGLYELLMRAHRHQPGLPIYVTENGIGLPDQMENGAIVDDARIEFVREHLKVIHRAIQDGANVRGYYMWALMDNFSWINGYKKRYGFLYIDRHTLARTRKKSSFWFADLAAANGFGDEPSTS